MRKDILELFNEDLIEALVVARLKDDLKMLRWRREPDSIKDREAIKRVLDYFSVPKQEGPNHDPDDQD